MSNTRQILARKNAASNICKVTGTMETISAVRYRQFYNQWQEGQGFTSLWRILLIWRFRREIDRPSLNENAFRKTRR
jgi:hypothetical protein